MVIDGKIARSARARLVRDGRVVWEGKIGSLRRFKDDAREVSAGYECGIGLENFNDVKPERRHRGVRDGGGRCASSRPRARTRYAVTPRPRSSPQT